MKKSILNIILRKCKLEIDNHPEYGNFMHWTFFVKNNKIISSGKNNFKEPDLKWGYHEVLKELGFSPKTHSELNCVLRSREKVSGAIAINVRLSRAALPRTSMPCSICFKLLQNIGIKKCYFTTDNNWSCLTF